MQCSFCFLWAHAEMQRTFNCILTELHLQKKAPLYFNELNFLNHWIQTTLLCIFLWSFVEGLAQKTGNCNKSNIESYSVSFLVLLEWTPESARLKPQIRKAFHSWLCTVFCFVWDFLGVFIQKIIFFSAQSDIFFSYSLNQDIEHKGFN